MKNLSLFVDRTGRRYGRLLVVSFAGQTHDKKSKWNCVCDCGNKNVATGANLHRGTIVSCGCFAREQSRLRCRTHGDSKVTEFKTWCGIKDRCTNPKANGYHLYGGAGIKVCARWLNSYENFLADMGRKPSPRHSIDRIDGTKGYSPDNCRWATWEDQANNRSNNNRLVFNGITLTVSQWARKTGILKSTLRERLNRGWSIPDALTNRQDSSRRCNIMVTHGDKTKSLLEWSVELKIPRWTIVRRIKLGRTISQIKTEFGIE